MSANPPILIGTPAAHPNEHIHRYLASVHPLQPRLAAEGRERFAREREYGFEEVRSVWENGNSSSLYNGSEVVIGKRVRAGSPPPDEAATRERVVETGVRTYGSLPVVQPAVLRHADGPKAKAKRRNVEEDMISVTSSADRREQRRLRRAEKKDIRRPPAPSPPPVHQDKRHNTDESEASGSQRYVAPPKRRKGNTDGLDIMANFEAKNVVAKRLTLKPGSAKGFLDKGASSAPARPFRRPSRLDLHDADWAMAWRKDSRNTSRMAPPARKIPDQPPAPRRAPLPQVPFQPAIPQSQSRLPPPGRTNSSPWPSDTRSTSSTSRQHHSSSSRLPIPRPATKFRFAPPRPPMDPSPFAEVGSLPRARSPFHRYQYPAVPQTRPGERQPLHPPTSRQSSQAKSLASRPPSQLALSSSAHSIEDLATDLKQGLRVRSSAKGAAAAMPLHRICAASDHVPVAAASVPGPKTPLVVLPLAEHQEDMPKVSAKTPLIHLRRTLPEPASSVLIRFSPAVPDPWQEQAAEPGRPLVHLGPSQSPTGHLSQPPSPACASPRDTTAQPEQLFTPSRLNARTGDHTSPTQLQLDYTYDSRFMSPRNPFLAMPPSYSCDSNPVVIYAFSSPPHGPLHATQPLSSYTGYEQYHAADELGNWAPAFAGALAEDERDEEDLRNFWKDRPAIL